MLAGRGGAKNTVPALQNSHHMFDAFGNSTNIDLNLFGGGPVGGVSIQTFGTSSKDAISACEKGQERQPGEAGGTPIASNQCLREGTSVGEKGQEWQPLSALVKVQDGTAADSPSTISACEKGQEWQPLSANEVVSASTVPKVTVESQIARAVGR